MWEDDTWDLKFASQLPSNGRFLQAVKAWQKGMDELEADKIDASIDHFADCLLLSERGAMVSAKWVETLPKIGQCLVARGREDPKALIVSAWVNLVGASLAAAAGEEDRTAFYKRAISCYEVLLELQPKNARGWLLLGGAQQLLHADRDDCITSWKKAHQLDPVLCIDAKFLIGAAEYNRGRWDEARKSLEIFVKSCGIDSRLCSTAYFLLCLLCFKATPPVQLSVTVRAKPESVSVAENCFLRGMEAELIREAWMPKNPPSVPRVEAERLIASLVKMKFLHSQPLTPQESVSKRLYAMLVILSFMIVMYTGQLLGLRYPAMDEFMRAKLTTGTDTWQWIWWGVFMCIRAVLTFTLFFFICNAIDTVAMRIRRRALVKEAQAKYKEPQLVA